MAKGYSPASEDVTRSIARMKERFHEDDLADATIGALFVFDLESTEPVLKHQGYPASAVVKITPLQDRAYGLPDAVITVDRSVWLTLTAPQRDALIDHELQHLELCRDEETGSPLYDSCDRPKLKMRRHDYQLGWFTVVAERHGDASPEKCYAKQLLAESGQLFFDFEDQKRAA